MVEQPKFGALQREQSLSGSLHLLCCHLVHQCGSLKLLNTVRPRAVMYSRLWVHRKCLLCVSGLKKI